MKRSLVFLVERAKDVPGEWVAYALNLDVVTQGRSIPHALHMLSEAVFHVTPVVGARAVDDDDWLRYFDVMQRGANIVIAGDVDPYEYVTAMAGGMVARVAPELGTPYTLHGIRWTEVEDDVADGQ